MAWPRLPLPVLAAVALAVTSVGLVIWGVGLRQENERLETQLRLARRGTRPAVPPPPRANETRDELRQENERLRQQLAQTTVPQVNVATIGLVPGPPQPDKGLPAGATALLVLTPPAGSETDEYRLRVLAYDGNVVWEGAGLRRGEDGRVTVVWPGSLSQVGDYRLELFGPGASGRRLASFRLLVRPDEGSGG